ncbi:hypothetical protein AB0A69_20685 [Streptomyces sp. NPDC045431]|uniref:hypothetical protein n=1 Tax=Streptomyces sp. NPDC045431 TaxID=3155613 RepID=UPI0033FB4F9E
MARTRARTVAAAVAAATAAAAAVHSWVKHQQDQPRQRYWQRFGARGSNKTCWPKR